MMTHRADAKKYYIEYIENLETGKELEDFVKYESKEVLKSVVERFENLKASGVFKNKVAPFDANNPVWHYDITALREMKSAYLLNSGCKNCFRLTRKRSNTPTRGRCVARHPDH